MISNLNLMNRKQLEKLRASVNDELAHRLAEDSRKSLKSNNNSKSGEKIAALRNHSETQSAG